MAELKISLQILVNKQTCILFYPHTDSSGLVSGLDSEMFLDFPDMGEVAIDSIFEQVSGRDENGDSLPRKLYNYFYSYKENSCKLAFNIEKGCIIIRENQFSVSQYRILLNGFYSSKA